MSFLHLTQPFRSSSATRHHIISIAMPGPLTDVTSKSFQGTGFVHLIQVIHPLPSVPYQHRLFPSLIPPASFSCRHISHAMTTSPVLDVMPTCCTADTGTRMICRLYDVLCAKSFSSDEDVIIVTLLLVFPSPLASTPPKLQPTNSTPFTSQYSLRHSHLSCRPAWYHQRHLKSLLSRHRD
jgi:hypothetical protein